MKKTLTQRVIRLEKFIETASQDNKYRITLKGETLSVYEYNPETRLEELSEQLEATKRLLSKVTQESGQIQNSLQSQEIDNARLSTDLRKVFDKRDKLVVDKKILERELDEYQFENKKLNKIVKKLKGKSPLNAYGGMEVLKLGIKKLLRR